MRLVPKALAVVPERRRRVPSLLLCGVLALLSWACADGDAIDEAANPPIEDERTTTAEPTSTAQPAPTAEPEPTAQPEPTAEPEPTAQAAPSVEPTSTTNPPPGECADLANSYVPVENSGVPPFGGTLFISSDIMSDSDPTSFIELEYSGQKLRTMFDRRTAQFGIVNAHIFEARYGTSTVVEIQVNPEFDVFNAEQEALFYATAIGRMPAFLFTDLETVWIHAGDELAGGGNNNLLIHTGSGRQYVADGILEELFLHEGAHTSLDSRHAREPAWRAAQQADGNFLSTYARDNPEREDVAESIGPWLAVRFFRDRIDSTLAEQIEATIPNRLRYFDCAGFTPYTVP